MTRLARIGGLRPPFSRIELTQIPYGNFQLPSLFHSSLRQDWRSKTAFLPYWTYSNPSHVNLRLPCGFFAYSLARINSDRSFAKNPRSFRCEGLWSRQGSNLDLELRKLLYYPLYYETNNCCKCNWCKLILLDLRKNALRICQWTKLCAFM